LAHLGQDAIAKLREANRAPVRKQCPQSRDCHHTQGCPRQQRGRVRIVESGQEVPTRGLFGMQHAVENEFQRPRFQQTQHYFTQQRREGTEDQSAMLPNLGPKETANSPGARKRLG